MRDFMSDREAGRVAPARSNFVSAGDTAPGAPDIGSDRGTWEEPETRRDGEERSTDVEKATLVSEPPPLAVHLDRRARVPLHRQLYDQLREAILTGRLAPGQRIPATRTLAEELDISRTTVLTAVRRLMVEGFLEARVGAGTWVSASLRDELRGRRERRASPESPSGRPTSERAAHLRRLAADVPVPAGPPRPFQVGVPALDVFPGQEWARLMGRHWRRTTGADLGYADRAGSPALRRAIAEYVGLSRGVTADADGIVVTTGSQMGLALAVQTLLDPGDAAWMEDPGYGGARAALVAAGARVVPVPVDGEGLVVAEARAGSEGARLAYVTPSHQFPLGVTLSLERRLALLRWAEETGAWVLEDDYDSEYRYEGRPLLSLQGLDGSARVVYLGTFSKTLFPGLRLGFLTLPRDLVEPLTAARYALDHHPPVPHQEALADFVGGGGLARHVRRMREVYRERRDALVDGLEARLGGGLTVLAAETGLHLTARFPEPRDDREVERRARARGLAPLALSPFYAGRPAASGLVLGFGATPVEEIERGVTELARVLEETDDG